MSAIGQPPAPAAAPPAAAAPKGTHNINQMHDLATRAEKDVSTLATAIGSVPGVDPAAAKSLLAMADVLRRIASGLGKAAPQPQPKRPTMDDAAQGMRQDMQAARQQQAGPTQ